MGRQAHVHTKKHFCGFLNQDNFFFFLFPFAATHSFASAKYILYPITSMKMCLSLFKGKVKPVTLKKETYWKNHRIWLIIQWKILWCYFPFFKFMQQAHKIVLLNHTAWLHLDNQTVSKVLPVLDLIRILPKSLFFFFLLKWNPSLGILYFFVLWTIPGKTGGNFCLWIRSWLQLSCYQWPRCPTSPKGLRSKLSPKLSRVIYDFVFQCPQSSNMNNAGYLNHIKQKHNS